MDWLLSIWKQQSLVEWIAAVVTLINVYLTIKNSIWCWLWGLISVVLYGWVFYEYKMYANMWLNVGYYLPMQFIGWYWWLRGGPKKSDDLPVVTLPNSARLGWLLLNIPLTIVWGWLLLHHTDVKNDPPVLVYLDALTTAMSVIGQYLMTRKYIENWLLWISANILYAFWLLPARKLYVSTGVYVILLVMAFAGYAEWRKIMQVEARRQEAGEVLPEKF